MSDRAKRASSPVSTVVTWFGRVMRYDWVVLTLTTFTLLYPIFGGTLIPGADPNSRWRFYVVASVLLTWRWRWPGLVSGIVISTLLLVGSQLWPLPTWTGESRQEIEDVVGIALVNILASIVAGSIVVQWGRADDLRQLAERNLAEAVAERAARQEAESRFRTLVEQMPAMIYINAYDPPHPMLYVSPHCHELFGYTPEQWMGESGFIYTIAHPDDLVALREENHRSEHAGDQFSLEYRVVSADGRVVWVRDESVLVHDDAGIPLFYQGIMLDITTRKQLEERLAHQAFHDTLTGLPNRALFMDRLEHAIARADRAGSRLAILYMDLDGFKRVNDTLGHAAGDALLAEVGQRLLSSIRSSDTAARLGGDEFTLLIEDIDNDAMVIQIADRIITSMFVSSEVHGRDVDVRASIGIAFRDPGSFGPDELLHRADTALYQAKHGGRGQHAVFGSSPARLAAGVGR